MITAHKKPTALITGVTGQDGSYLAEFLLAKGYNVVGLVRHTSGGLSDKGGAQIVKRMAERGEITLMSGDLCDISSLKKAIFAANPREVYNLAAQSYVPESWRTPLHTSAVTGMGVLNVLEAIREVSPTTRFYQASSSEMFGAVLESPQTERTPFNPRSPYAVAKTFGHYMTKHYREAYGMHASSGILFNHESERRGEEFVTRKITLGATRIARGLQSKLHLGNLDARRDWGFAGDYVEAMWLMLQQDNPDDYVIGTGVQRSVREFARLAFERAGLNYEDFIVVDPEFYRPAEVMALLADPTKAAQKLGWKPKTTLEELVSRMVYHDRGNLVPNGSG